MILTGQEIKNRLGKEIVISPFDESSLNPNSYNLRIHNELLVYTEDILDPYKQNKYKKIIIPDEGLVLQPNVLYLFRTVEYTETHGFVPIVHGRSSLARLGVSVHVTGGFGDIGFCGYWTLQLKVSQKTRIYPGMKICQIYYQSVLGDIIEYNSNKYQNNSGIQLSKLYLEREKNEMNEKASLLYSQFIAKPYKCVAATLSLALYNLSSIRIEQDEIASSLGLKVPSRDVKENSNEQYTDDINDIGIEIHEEALKKWLDVKRLAVEVSYEEGCKIAEIGFEDKIARLLKANYQLIVLYSYGELVFQRELADLGHASVILDIDKANDFIKIFDPGPTNAGIKKISTLRLYDAMRFKGGLLELKKYEVTSI